MSEAQPDTGTDYPIVELAIWGPSAAGKTMYLAQVYFKGRRHRDWEVFPSREGSGFEEQMQKESRAENRFPRATESAARGREIAYDLQNDRAGVRARIVVEDRAGSDFEELADGEHSPLQRLRDAGGLLVLLDPQSDQATLLDRVARTWLSLYRLRTGPAGKDARPVAVCITKSDMAIGSPEALQRATDPDTREAFARELISSKVLDEIESYCSNVRLFPISAAGVRRGYGLVESAVFVDENLETRLDPDGEPVNLLAPLEWLILHGAPKA